MQRERKQKKGDRINRSIMCIMIYNSNVSEKKKKYMKRKKNIMTKKKETS